MIAELVTACTLLIAVGEPIECPVPVPPIHEVCISLTNYWPYDKNGKPVAWGGQADDDPYHTATMYELTNADTDRWSLVAGPLSLLGRTICMVGWRCYPIRDTFGVEAYQDGVFWHDIYQQYVFGIDALTDWPVHELVCNWWIE